MSSEDSQGRELMAQFQRFDELEKSGSEEAVALAEELDKGLWAEQFSDYFMAMWDLEFARQYNRTRSPNDLYRNTAGEIEARDTATRRRLSPAERKNTPPDLGGQGTVFAEGAVASAEYVGKTADGIEVYETSEEVKRLPWKERKRRFAEQMSNQFRGRTAKFILNGHAYYATFDQLGVNKNIYGDDKSDFEAKDAKVNVGADAGIFE